MYLFRAVDSMVPRWTFISQRSRMLLPSISSARPWLRLIILVRASSTWAGNPPYPQRAASRLKQERRLGQRCWCRTSPYPKDVNHESLGQERRLG